MQIKLYGNGHSCNIPVQEIIDKYWKDETAPFSFEMSTAIGDETIAATAMLGEERRLFYQNKQHDNLSGWSCSCKRLLCPQKSVRYSGSRNGRKNPVQHERMSA